MNVGGIKETKCLQSRVLTKNYSKILREQKKGKEEERN